MSHGSTRRQSFTGSRYSHVGALANISLGQITQRPLAYKDQGRTATTGGTSTEIVAGEAGTGRFVEIWLDNDSDPVHIALGEDATTDHPMLEGGDGALLYTTQTINAIKTGSGTEVTINHWAAEAP